MRNTGSVVEAPPAPEATTGPAASRRPTWAVTARSAPFFAVTLGALAAAGVWIWSVAATAGHGFDITDEGYYLLSYRWWQTNLRTFTGVQYLYGPVFQLLGHDIAALRLVRLGTVVATHLVLGWSFMRWLRTRRPRAPATRWWEPAGTAVVLAAGGLVYGWLPLTPAYNDVSLLGALLLTAVTLRFAADVNRGARTRAWVPVAFGVLIVAMLLAKWSSLALSLAVVGVAALVVLAPLGVRAMLRVLGWTLAGAVAAVVAVQFLVIPLPDAVPQMLETNRLVAASFNSPDRLLAMYGDTSLDVLRTVGTDYRWMLLAALVAAVARGRVASIVAGAIGAVAVVFTVDAVLADHGFGGGTRNLLHYPAALLLTFVVAVVAGGGAMLLRRHRRRRRGVAVLHGPAVYLMLLLTPVVQAFGTGNPVHYLVVNGFAAWVAIMIGVLSGIGRRAYAARGLTAAAVAGAVLLATSIATDGVLHHPYRTAPPSATTTVAAGIPPLRSVRLTPETAHQYEALSRALQPWMSRPGRAVMGFDRMAGLVLMLGGRPVGEAWYARTDHERTAAGIRSQCPGGRGWWGDREPVLLFNRKVLPVDTAALASCGLVMARDYRLLAPPAQTMGLHVYVPLGEGREG